MAIDPNMPFALHDLFFNEIMGDVTLGILLATILFLFNVIRFKISYPSTMLLGIILLGILYSDTKIQILWVIAGVIPSLIFYYNMIRIIDRAG